MLTIMTTLCASRHHPHHDPMHMHLTMPCSPFLSHARQSTTMLSCHSPPRILSFAGLHHDEWKWQDVPHGSITMPCISCSWQAYRHLVHITMLCTLCCQAMTWWHDAHHIVITMSWCLPQWHALHDVMYIMHMAVCDDILLSLTPQNPECRISASRRMEKRQDVTQSITVPFIIWCRAKHLILCTMISTCMVNVGMPHPSWWRVQHESMHIMSSSTWPYAEPYTWQPVTSFPRIMINAYSNVLSFSGCDDLASPALLALSRFK